LWRVWGKPPGELAGARRSEESLVGADGLLGDGSLMAVVEFVESTFSCIPHSRVLRGLGDGGVRGFRADIASEQLKEELAEDVGLELADEFAAFSDADVAGFFGDDDDDGVGFLAHADGGAVSAAEFLLEFAAFREGELDAGVSDATVADDDTQVVQRGIGPEDGVEQARGEVGVDAGAALRDSAKADIAFNGDQSADLPPREEGGRFDEGIDIGVELAGEVSEKACFAELHEGAADFGLEDDDRGEEADQEQAAVEELDTFEPQFAADKGDNQVGDNEQEADAFEHAHSAGSAEEAKDAVDEQADQEPLDGDAERSVDADGVPEVVEAEESHKRGRSVLLSGRAGQHIHLLHYIEVAAKRPPRPEKSLMRGIKASYQADDRPG